MKNSDITEKRKHRRFQVKDNAFVELDVKPITIGQLIDIGRGGLAFRYATNCTPPSDLLELNIYSLGNGFSLEKVPVHTISDNLMRSESAFNLTKMRRRNVEFLEANNNQKSQLNYFIQNYTYNN